MAVSYLCRQIYYFRQPILQFSRRCCTKNDTKILSLIRNDLNANKDITMVPFRLEGCVFGDNFSDAQLDVSQYMVDRKGNVKSLEWMSEEDIDNGDIGTFAVDFKVLFSRGFKVLEQHLAGTLNVDMERHQMFDIDSKRFHRAFDTFLAFLGNVAYHERCLRFLFDDELNYLVDNEPVIAALLANHLLSKLAKEGQGGYHITNDTKGKVIYCPCKSHDCRQFVRYGGNAFGSIYLWHGKPDIVIVPAAGGELNVVIPPKDKVLYVDNENEEEVFVETMINSSPLRSKKAIQQIVAQTITFAFYQNKLQYIYGHRSASLIPTIAACPKSFDIYMYDTKNDILLRNAGDPIALWSERHLDLSSLLQLWMLINHFLLKPNLHEDDIDRLGRSCGLQKHLGEKGLQMIDDTITMQHNFLSSYNEEYKELPYFHHSKYSNI